MSIETFRIEFLHDESREKLWGNDLFLNIYDFWCISRDGFLLKDYSRKNSLLKTIIRKKMRGNKELPTYKILLRMCAKREEQFNPMVFLHRDWENYFHILKDRRRYAKKTFLNSDHIYGNQNVL